MARGVIIVTRPHLATATVPVVAPHAVARLHLRRLRACGLSGRKSEYLRDLALEVGVGDRVHVLDGGRTLAEGTPAEIRASREVRQAYLGAAAAA